jgi:hypothetical protein
LEKPELDHAGGMRAFGQSDNAGVGRKGLPDREKGNLTAMAETTKLSVEKALQKLRGSDQAKTKNERLDEKADALDEEIKRMRAQRLRLDQRQRKRD